MVEQSESSATAGLRLIACHECDLLQRETALPTGGVARCARCSAVLYRSRADSIERSLALTLAAIVLFVIANLFPVIGLEVQGERIETTLFGTVRALYDQDRVLVAALVCLTTIIMPAVELGAMAYLLIPLRLNQTPPAAALVFRMLGLSRPWGMVEVFMLGILVALVKLAQLAGVLPGIAMWSIFGLMFILAAAASAFDPRALWARLERKS